jgi:hypothetical protein
MKNVFLFSLIFLLSIISYTQTTIVCNETGDFSEGLASFKLDDKWGFINTKGEVVIQPKYSNPFEQPKFSNGLCGLIDPATKKWGYLDKTGNIAIPFTLYTSTPFFDEVTVNYAGGDAAGKLLARWRIINRKGEILLETSPNDYTYKTYYKEGLARLSKKFKYGFMDATGKLVIENKYEDVRDFSEGLAAVKLNGKWGYLDHKGNVKIDFQYSEEPQSFSCGRAFVHGTNYKWALIDTLNKIIIQPTLEQVFPYSEGLAIVSLRDAKGTEFFKIIDSDGKSIKEFKPTGKEKDIIIFKSGFSEGLAIANQGYGNNLGFIDSKGKTAIDYKFSKLNPFSNGLAYAEKTDAKTNMITKGFIDKKGKFEIVIEPKKF